MVLIVLALAAALAAPALLSRRVPAERGLGLLLSAARAAAAARGETLYLRVGPSGDWRLDGAASLQAGAVDSGHVEPFPGLPFTLIISPTGTCGFEAGSAAAAAVIYLDPMSCELRQSSREASPAGLRALAHDERLHHRHGAARGRRPARYDPRRGRDHLVTVARARP